MNGNRTGSRINGRKENRMNNDGFIFAVHPDRSYQVFGLPGYRDRREVEKALHYIVGGKPYRINTRSSALIAYVNEADYRQQKAHCGNFLAYDMGADSQPGCTVYFLHNADQIRGFTQKEIEQMARDFAEKRIAREKKKMTENLAELIYGCSPRMGEEEAISLAENLILCGAILLPCKVGETIYSIEPSFRNYQKIEGVQEGVCKKYELNEQYGWVVWAAMDQGEPHTLYAFSFGKFGKTVFLDRAEAEAAGGGERQ